MRSKVFLTFVCYIFELVGLMVIYFFYDLLFFLLYKLSLSAVFKLSTASLLVLIKYFVIVLMFKLIVFSIRLQKERFSVTKVFFIPQK